MRTLSGRGARAALVCLAVLAAACGGGPSSQPPAPSAGAAAPVQNPVDPATAAVLSGTVSFTGRAPAREPIKMASDPHCLEVNPGATTESVVVGGDGGLQNVFVYVKEGLGDLRFPVPTTPVVLDQRGCQYHPHVFGVQVGQPMEILNSDDTLHNIHAMPEANQEFNRGQAQQRQRDTHVFSTREVMVPFKCDVHRWMQAYVGVLDHPFFAVTTANGAFELKGLPPGTYTIEAWHETLGTKTQVVTLAAKDAKAVAFAFSR